MNSSKIIAIPFMVLSMLAFSACMTMPSSDEMSAIHQLWHTPIKTMGQISHMTDDTFTNKTGGLLNTKFDVYSLADGAYIKSYTPKELSALQTGDDSGIGKVLSEGFYYNSKMVAKRMPPNGPDIWKYSDKARIVGGLVIDDFLFMAEKDGASPDLYIAKIDASSGEALWRTKAGIELQESISSLRSDFVTDYHLQLSRNGNRLYVISKGLAVMDFETGKSSGTRHFPCRAACPRFARRRSGRW